MAKILSEERVLEYSNEFKVTIVELTEHLDVQTAQVATVLGLHPVMVYRWQMDHRKGELKENKNMKPVNPSPKRRANRTDPVVIPPKTNWR